jgi:sugar phosphate isomerase/epimerase
MRLMLEDHGLVITELDPLLNWLPAKLLGWDPSTSQNPLFTTTEDTWYRIAEAIGGRHLNLVQAFGPRLDAWIVAEAFAGVCNRAAQHGLKVSLEFLPWSGIPDMKTAVDIVEKADRPNGGVLLDTWHHFRSGHGSEDLLALHGDIIVAIQINDAAAQPTSDLIKESIHGRLLPGQGAIDLVSIIRALDSIGCEAPVGVEVFSDELKQLPPIEAARRAGDAARAVLAKACLDTK